MKNWDPKHSFEFFLGDETKPHHNAWWNHFCRIHLNYPVPLQTADLTTPFIYYRRWGVFKVPSGYHQETAAFLATIDANCKHPQDACLKLNLKSKNQLVDHFLENTKGIAFKSSVSNTVYTWDNTTLNKVELSLFKKNVKFLKQDN